MKRRRWGRGGLTEFDRREKHLILSPTGKGGPSQSSIKVRCKGTNLGAMESHVTKSGFMRGFVFIEQSVFDISFVIAFVCISLLFEVKKKEYTGTRGAFG